MKSVWIALLLVFGTALAAGWTSYRSSALGFSIQHPTGWQVNASSSDVTFRALGKDQQLLAEFAVGVRKPMPLAAWVKARQREETLPDGSSRVESVRDVQLAGRPAKRIVLFGFDRYIREEAVLANGRLYVISYDHDNPNDPNFKTHQAIYATMRSSLKF